jgi:DNA (cytosine-5)-methyltransferase 1
MEKLKVGSLFAGVGGLCEAFKQSSCNILWSNEIDANACITYRLNHDTVDSFIDANENKTHLIEGDIKGLSANNLKKIDILTAGFPCQPFSQAGHGKGFKDDRGMLFFELSRILRELQPKAFLFENVKTLATHDKGKSFELIKNEIIEAGYSFIPFILNASEHTSVPQGRQRIYIVGFRGEYDFFYNKPVKENVKRKVQCLLSSKFVIPLKSPKPLKQVSDFLEDDTVQDNDFYNKKENKIHQRIIEAVTDGATVYQYRRYYVRDNKSNVCPTLTANMGAGGHNIPIILDKKTLSPRRLTPKECFNLQGFPRSFNLPINISRGQLYKQAGNSVVVPMVQMIAKEIVRVLNENNHERDTP